MMKMHSSIKFSPSVPVVSFLFVLIVFSASQTTITAKEQKCIGAVVVPGICTNCEVQCKIYQPDLLGYFCFDDEESGLFACGCCIDT